MSIDWHALGTVFVVTLVATVGLVGVFTLGIVATGRRGGSASAASASSGSPASSGPSASSDPSGTGGGAALLARTGGWVCFAACAAAVAYGIHLIVG
ncbi:hypothetical protein SAMN05216251_10961 [Actinacidiphila alni]|uniref:Uncharacterized protein n=1 Tax=Actinacidiphila alni TaxID=380248 RepID=A0A1I2GJI8_9ACTN|nr:hypothetical protein [Actinacidiphila alni]SFF16791.1 hypothetical protein SAMN05216251_10961 [Actinacidiphila alni]